MNSITFLTGNKGKLAEAHYIFKENIYNIDVDTDEIQSINGEEVIRHKMETSLEDNDYFQGQSVFCEDTSLEIENMNGFPGALVKFYYNSLGDEGFVKFNGNSRATMISWIAYANFETGIHYFTSETKGTIPNTPVMGSYGFGFDAVFVPDGSTKSLAQMPPEEKMLYSARYKALLKLKEYLK